MKVVFLVAPGVHLLDLAGPAQAFGTAGELGEEPWEPMYVAETPVVVAHQGLPLHTATAWPRLGSDDLIVVPGWKVAAGADTSRFSAATLERVADHHAAGGTVMSVCAGAFALAEAGLLTGRRATTHHELQDVLARRYPGVRVVRDVLYVSAGRIHTSAGIASGTDLALHLIAGRLGTRVASRVARAMVVYARRNGDEPQQSILLQHRDHVDDLVHRAQDVIDDHYARPLPLGALARQLAVSERTLTRTFTRVVGMTPLRYQQSLRREHAERLIASGTPVEAAAREVGFEDARMLRRLRRTCPTASMPSGTPHEDPRRSNHTK